MNMTLINTIPHKIPKQLLKKLEKREYDDIILFALGIYGPHEQNELVNSPENAIFNRMDREIFIQSARKLKEIALIEDFILNDEIYYRITPKGEEKLMKRFESSRIVRRMLKTFAYLFGSFEKENELASKSISGYHLTYKDYIFGLLSYHWRMKTFREIQCKFNEIGPEKNISVGKTIEENARIFTHNVALKYEDREYTYKELNEWVNRYANFFLSLGIKKGEVVNVLLENRPEILFIIGAMSKIGAIASLINTRQRAATLAYSLTINKVRFYIIGEELISVFEDVKPKLNLNKENLLFFVKDSEKIQVPEDYVDLVKRVRTHIDKDPLTTLDNKGEDTYAYIFTSGTTDFPKASHMRNMHTVSSMLSWGKSAFYMEPDDVIYVCLPLFHSNAIQVGWASALSSGAAIAIGRRFSATNFWKECIKYGATCFNYIGEICRYLYNQPPSSLDRKHSVYKIGGNGLKPEIWIKFKDRFGITEVYEHYGMTEMMGMFCNYLNRDKTVGMCTVPYAIVKYDIVNEEPLLNDEGFYQHVDKGEAGLLLLKMVHQFIFAGYTNEQSNKKKLISNVFEKSDLWYNTGDILRNIGYYHAQFVDRLGDTFRWKGENVSTSEVEDIIELFNQVKLSSVYGVKISGTEGRAGMASIVKVNNYENLDFGNFLRLLRKNLPIYAIPIFIRILPDFATTSTFKIQKSILKNEGFDIRKMKEPVYVLLPNNEGYVPLTREIYNKILDKEYRF